MVRPSFTQTSYSLIDFVVIDWPHFCQVARVHLHAQPRAVFNQQKLRFVASCNPG